MSLVTHWSVWSCVCTAPPRRLASCPIWWKAFQTQSAGCCGTSRNLSSCPRAPSPPDMESRALLVYTHTWSRGLWGWSAWRTQWWIDKASGGSQHWYESHMRHQRGSYPSRVLDHLHILLSKLLRVKLEEPLRYLGQRGEFGFLVNVLLPIFIFKKALKRQDINCNTRNTTFFFSFSNVHN